MSNCELLYVKGMNVSDSEEVEEDVWDDTKLNEAYDKALKIANVEVAKRIAMSTNTQENKDGNSKKKKGKSTSKSSSSKKNVEWKSGMPCRAVYEDDGMEYEAFLVRIINDKECIVKFFGYENSEIVTLNSLKPSLGKEERMLQIEQAVNDKADDGFGSDSPNCDNMEYSTDRIPSPGSTERSFRKKKTSKSKKKQSGGEWKGFDLPDMMMPNLPMMHDLGSMDMPIPPPPPLNFTNNSSHTEEQAISSMLISWYMTGYYTGLYQGMKRAKEPRRKK